MRVNSKKQNTTKLEFFCVCVLVITTFIAYEILKGLL